MKSKRTAEGDAFAAFSIAVLRLAGHLQAEGDTLAKPAGQTSARWQVLAAADHAPMSVADAARALGLARQGVELTEAGRVALSDIQGRQAKWADRHGGKFGEQRLREATAVIAEVLASLSGKQQA
jgi:hypothetical protein